MVVQIGKLLYFTTQPCRYRKGPTTRAAKMILRLRLRLCKFKANISV
jgi:hypothetical protein